MTEERARLLAELLREVQQDNWFWPNDAFEAANGTVSNWAPELVILRSGRTEILLAMYECGPAGGAKHFEGMWHIPGGYNRFPEQDVQTVCSRLAQRELGMDVVLRGVIDAIKWRSIAEDPIDGHPYGRPLSLFFECEPVLPIIETEKLRFFPVNELPTPMVGVHKKFIGKNLAR